MLQEDLDALQESAFRETYTRILQEWKYDDAIDNLSELDGFYHIVPPASTNIRPRSLPGYHRSVWEPGLRILIEQR